jgi:HSP20 family protein
MATWDPFDGLEGLRRQVDQAFEQYGPQYSPMFRTAFLPGRGAREYPLINIYDDENAVYLEALAPGADPASFNISIMQDTLTLSGEKPRVPGEVKPEAFHREERAAGKFVRSISLPVDIEDTQVKAEYRNGLLLITAPKSEKAKPKQINVQVT